jgi:tRNA (guanine6-N2)-methyltransferase
VKITTFYEASVNEGLEDICASELRHRFGGQVQVLHAPGRWPGAVQFRYNGNVNRLLQLKSVLSIFHVHQFPVPRPLALLGHQNFQYLLEQIRTVRQLSPKGAFKTVYLAAAGSESRVMTRLIGEVAQQTGLTVAPDEGDLLLRLRRPLDRAAQGWDVMIRMGPRPLSTRDWRVCDYKGALNAAVAHALAVHSQASPEDVFLNTACGSGTILIERAHLLPFKMAIGCDTNPEALRCARENAAASRLPARVVLAPWDASALPLPNQSVDVICSDLPFGHYIGSHQENIDLYPALLREAARVLRPKGRSVFLTHEIRLMAGLLENAPEWLTEKVIPLTLNGLHPRIYLLRKNPL